MPLLSIITVVLNAKNDLSDTLKSIREQCFKDIEVIVIDGGSTDGTDVVIADNTDLITYSVSEPDNGIYDAMNKGILAAKGNWITFLNAGDYYVSSDRLSTVFKNISTQHHFIYGDMFLLTEKGEKIRYLKAEKLTQKSITKGMIACHQAMFVRREKCPHYLLDLRHQGDLNWVMDILDTVAEKNICYVDCDLVYFKAGGFSDQTILQQLKEHLYLIINRYGYTRLLLTIPRLIRRYAGKWIRRFLGIATFRFWIRS
ncbi:glycosyltransferase [Candidatus Marinamargulisbacteria bacterium SCGC AG-414-C22]|nr:glycosyltransferase [Candidatus Marinamargulisbacteria bacterium SCGC AG-414-C22]